MTTPHHYRFGGVRLASELPLPAPPAGPGREGVEFTLRLRPGGRAPDPAGPDAVRHAEEMDGEPYLCVYQAGSTLVFRYYGRLDFVLDEGRGCVTCCCRPGTSEELIQRLFFGPLGTTLLQLGGHHCLHASAVVVDGAAAVFLGRSGAGKSTLAGFFARHGHALLADDSLPLAVVDGEVRAFPNVPLLAVWPDAAGAVWGAAAAARPTFPGAEKLKLLPPQFEPCARPRPLGALYLLAPRGEDGPPVEPVAPREAFRALEEALYGNFVTRPEWYRQQWELLTRMARSGRCRRLRRPRGFDGLAAVYDRVRADLAAPGEPRPAAHARGHA